MYKVKYFLKMCVLKLDDVNNNKQCIVPQNSNRLSFLYYLLFV